MPRIRPNIGIMLAMPAQVLLRRFLLGGGAPLPADEDEGAACVTAAIEQGLAALLHEAVLRQGLPWPARALAALRDAHRAALARGVRQLEAARRVLALLAGQGLRGLPLKGVAVAETLYDGVADRPMADVDILALDDFPAALRVLEAAGFRRGEAADHACGLVDPETDVVVELHRSVTSCGSVFPLDAERLWSRSRPAAGRVPRLPAPEDLLVQLALHAAFQHGLALRLVQYLDFRRVFERTPPSHAALLEAARASRAESSLALALAAATALVGAPVPPALTEELARFLPARRAAWFGRRAADASTLVAPARSDLLRLRWWLAGDRRWALLAAALGTNDAAPAPLWRRLGRTATRAASLAWRWSPHAGRP
jgi:hypothetical protein